MEELQVSGFKLPADLGATVPESWG